MGPIFRSLMLYKPERCHTRSCNFDNHLNFNADVIGKVRCGIHHPEHASTCSAISVATFGRRFIKKCVAPILIFKTGPRSASRLWVPDDVAERRR